MPIFDDYAGGGSRSLRVLFFVATMAAVAFATLWWSERGRQPQVIVREITKPIDVPRVVPVERVKLVPVEKVKEVPKEVIKEIPAELTEAEKAALEFSSNYVAAPNLSSLDDALYKLDSIAVRVNLRDEVKKVISEDQLKARYETLFRGRGIRLDDRSPYWLGVNYDGCWNDNLLIYGVHMELYDSVTIDRGGDLRRTYAIVWAHDDLGYASRELASPVILSNADTNAEFFASRYLGVQGRAR
jgi:hypothetical protein